MTESEIREQEKQAQVKHLTQIQLYNTFGRTPDQAITWKELLKRMEAEFGLNRDQVLEGMNELIDDGRIIVYKPDVYCLPRAVKKLNAEKTTA